MAGDQIGLYEALETALSKADDRLRLAEQQLGELKVKQQDRDELRLVISKDVRELFDGRNNLNVEVAKMDLKLAQIEQKIDSRSGAIWDVIKMLLVAALALAGQSIIKVIFG